MKVAPKNLGPEVNPRMLQIGTTYYVHTKEPSSLRKWTMEGTFHPSSSVDYIYVTGRYDAESIHSTVYEVGNPDGRALNNRFFVHY